MRVAVGARSLDSTVAREVRVIPKPCDQDAFPVLGNETLAIDDFREDTVSKLCLKNMLDDSERVALVVTQEILHIFQEERFWTLGCNDAFYVKDERTLRAAIKAVRAA